MAFTFKENRVKKISSIGIPSVFRMSLILGAAAGLMLGLTYMIYDFKNRQYAEGIATLIILPLGYALGGALVNALMAWIYNRAAPRFGGIEIEFEDL